MSKHNRLPGHELRSAFVDVQAKGSGKARLGRAECVCGATSPLLSHTKRLQWHRDHKDEIRAGGAQ